MEGQPTMAHRPSQTHFPFYFILCGLVLFGEGGFQESQGILRLTVQLKMTLTFLPS